MLLFQLGIPSLLYISMTGWGIQGAQTPPPPSEPLIIVHVINFTHILCISNASFEVILWPLLYEKCKCQLLGPSMGKLAALH